MQAFFYNLFTPDRCCAVIEGDAPVAAGYLIPAGNLVVEAHKTPCAMIYAVASLPEHRNRGYGTTVVRELITVAHSDGYPAVVLCPSDDSLFEFYSVRAGFRDWFYLSEQRFDGFTNTCPRDNRRCETLRPATRQKKLNSEVFPPANHISRLHETGPGEYSLLREKLLSGIPHIEYDQCMLSYQSVICREYGGGLFKIETDYGTSCAVVEAPPDGPVAVKELLSPGPHDSGSPQLHDSDSPQLNGSDSPQLNGSCTPETAALSEIAAAFPADKYIVRTPARESSAGTAKPNSTHATANTACPNTRRFGMLAVPDCRFASINGRNASPWYGLAFD